MLSELVVFADKLYANVAGPSDDESTLFSILSIIISISMILTMIIAGLFGILVPVTLKKMNIDPAIASSVFVTTITDVIGFVSFLGVGAYFL